MRREGYTGLFMLAIGRGYRTLGEREMVGTHVDEGKPSSHDGGGD